MENYVLENGITLRNALKLEIEKEVYYISKAQQGYIVYNALGAGKHVPDISQVEKLSGCRVEEDNFIIGCVTVPKHFLELGKKIFSERASELEDAIANKKTKAITNKSNKDAK